MEIVEATEEHVTEWSELRALLWPEESPSEHREEIRRMFLADQSDRIAMIAITAEGDLAGFAEAGLRREYVEGCLTSPVVYLEGIFIAGAKRNRGLGRQLVDKVQEWGLAQGCKEFASDAMLENVASQSFHQAIGFEEAGRIVAFRKSIA